MERHPGDRARERTAGLRGAEPLESRLERWKARARVDGPRSRRKPYASAASSRTPEVRVISSARERAALVALFAVAALQYAWNAYGVPPLTGYDAGGHAGYLLTILSDARLPHPYEGWSTFHPPLYYVLGAGVWSVFDSLGPRAVVMSLRSLGALAGLATGGVAFLLVRRTGGSFTVAWVASAVALFLPSAQIATVMIGNEAFAAGLGALALPSLLALQRDPRNVRAALITALFAGLAFDTKYTGGFVVAGCAVPFARRDFDRSMASALTAALLVAAVLVGPVYARNVVLTGTPFPILREHEPTASQEARNVLRPRRIGDYLWIDPEALARPSIYHIDGPSSSELRRNPAMTNVWGLAYASTWYDAFAHRIPVPFHREGVLSGPVLAALGVVPTLMTLLGFGLAVAAAWSSRGRSEDAPFVVIWLTGLAMFVGFTSWAQSVVAVKGSYLLPLLAPGAVFFARGVGFVRGDVRRIALGVSATAALAACVVFTHDLVFPAPPVEKMARIWRLLGSALPESHIAESVDRLTIGW